MLDHRCLAPRRLLMRCTGGYPAQLCQKSLVHFKRAEIRRDVACGWIPLTELSAQNAKLIHSRNRSRTFGFHEQQLTPLWLLHLAYSFVISVGPYMSRGMRMPATRLVSFAASGCVPTLFCVTGSASAYVDAACLLPEICAGQATRLLHLLRSVLGTLRLISMSASTAALRGLSGHAGDARSGRLVTLAV